MTAEFHVRREVHYDSRIVRCIADRPSNIDEMFLNSVKGARSRIAIAAGGCSVTYAELDQRVQMVASNLVARGFRRGERIALLLGNRLEFLLVVLAAARIGMILVPMNVRQRKPEILYMLTHSRASALVIDMELLAELPDISVLPAIRSTFVVGGTSPLPPLEPFDGLLGQHGAVLHPVVVGEDEPFCILYTSGTTGRPKGAILTHLGVIHSVIHLETGLQLQGGDVGALAVPASHVTGLVAVLLTMLRVAGTTVMLEQFRAKSFLQTVEAERISYTLMVPAMYKLCLFSLEAAQPDLSSWRVGGFGGAPMPAQTIRDLAGAIPTLLLSNIYGATETTSPVSILPSRDALFRCDSVGRQLPCADVVVIDSQGREVTPGERGELLISGPMVIPGYWENPEANSSSFVAGYWRSGDIGSVDEKGYLQIHDRMKDVINRGGYKIYCVEVENVIAEHPDVAECAVLGYPDEVLGERVQVFVFAVEGVLLGEDQLRDFCAARLSDYKVPERVTFLKNPLPRNANGKVSKMDLRLADPDQRQLLPP